MTTIIALVFLGWIALCITTASGSLTTLAEELRRLRTAIEAQNGLYGIDALVLDADPGEAATEEVADGPIR